MTIQCPSEPAETAEAYCMGQLSAGETEQFEEHFLICPRCIEEVQYAGLFFRGMQAAAIEMSTSDLRF